MKSMFSFLFFCSIFLVGCSEDKKTLYVYNWADYIDPEVIQKFEEKYNCRVDVSTFDSNESAYAKLKSGGGGYDLMVPSSYMIPQLKDEGLIEPFDHSLIPNVIQNFDESFKDQISDHNLTYSVPYTVTYTGLMFSKTKIDLRGDISWNIFTDKTLKNNVSLLDDIREVIGAGLMVNGYSLNSENPKEIEMATETVLKWKKNIRKFDAESYKTEIPGGVLKIGHGYSSDANQIIFGDDKRNDIVFVLPKEGFTVAFDEFVILKNAKNRVLAHKFVDFIYETENSVANMMYNFSPIPNKDAIKSLDEDYRKVIIIPKETMKRGQVLKAFKSKETFNLYNKAWDKIKAIEK